MDVTGATSNLLLGVKKPAQAIVDEVAFRLHLILALASAIATMFGLTCSRLVLSCICAGQLASVGQP